MWAEVNKNWSSCEIKVSDVTDFSNFMNAVIDEKSFDNIMSYIDFAKNRQVVKLLQEVPAITVGYFVQPTIIETTDPYFKTMQEEIFGPVVTIYVYDDKEYEQTLELCNKTSIYGLTGAVFANDRYAVVKAYNTLRYAAGNFYINDKPSGAVVGLQPFGGSRAQEPTTSRSKHKSFKMGKSTLLRKLIPC